MRHNLEDKTVEALIDDLQKEAVYVSKGRANRRKEKTKESAKAKAKFLIENTLEKTPGTRHIVWNIRKKNTIVTTAYGPMSMITIAYACALLNGEDKPKSFIEYYIKHRYDPPGE